MFLRAKNGSVQPQSLPKDEIVFFLFVRPFVRLLSPSKKRKKLFVKGFDRSSSHFYASAAPGDGGKKKKGNIFSTAFS